MLRQFSTSEEKTCQSVERVSIQNLVCLLFFYISFFVHLSSAPILDTSHKTEPSLRLDVI